MNQNAGRVTFDANIYFYSVDELNPVKHCRCDEILRAAMKARVDFVTLQTLGEFAHAVVRKQVLTATEAAQAARDWATIFEVETVTTEAFELALDWWSSERLSYWDALSIATSARAGATACITEDLNDGASFAGVEIINPFGRDSLKRIAVHGLDV